MALWSLLANSISTISMGQCAPSFVNIKDDGTAETYGSALDDEKAAIEQAQQQVTNYCGETNQRALILEQTISSKVVPTFRRDCHNEYKPCPRRPSVSSSKAERVGGGQCSTEVCTEIFTGNATKWTAKLRFTCH